MLKTTFPNIHSECPICSTSNIHTTLDDYDEEGDFSGIWADELNVYLSVKSHIESKIRFAISDFKKLHEILSFGSIEISLPGTARAAAVAFYKWRNFYDAGEGERWAKLNQSIQNGKVEMQNGLLPRLADLIWESRKANRAVFEHELYATFIYFLLRAKKAKNLTEISWQESPDRHFLLPTWEIETRCKGSKVLVLHCRTNRVLADHLLDRMHGESPKMKIGRDSMKLRRNMLNSLS
jgi:hypothetical protein